MRLVTTRRVSAVSGKVVAFQSSVNFSRTLSSTASLGTSTGEEAA